MSQKICFIAAIDDELGLAKGGRLPWDIPSDRKFFRDSIATAPGLMGWKTFVDHGKKPFGTNPRNILITHRDVQYDGVEVIHDLRSFIKDFKEDLWVIGGGDVFAQLLPYATHLYLTRVQGDFNCDTFFPEFEDIFKLHEASEWHEENGHTFRYELWTK